MSGPDALQSRPIPAPRTSPAGKRFLRAALAQHSCSRSSAAATSRPSSRSPRNGRPPRAATRPSPRLRSPVAAGPQNTTLASPTPEKENQCLKIRSSLTPWESRRFKSGGNRFSAPFPKFVIHLGPRSHELRKQRGTSDFMILVPLFDLKFLIEFAAGGVGTSNRRH